MNLLTYTSRIAYDVCMMNRAENVRIGDTIFILGAGLTVVHAVHIHDGLVNIHFTDGTSALCLAGDQVDVIDYAPATDADFENL